MTDQNVTTSAKEVTRLRDLKASARDQLFIDPRIIEIDPNHNPRNYDLPENRQHLDELKASIRINGTVVPLLVRFEPSTKKAVLVDGECRLRANLELIGEGVEIESVPTVQVSGNNEAERLLIAITANTGKPLTPLESGVAFKRFIGFGWSQEKIAERTGYTLATVKQALALHDTPQEVQQLVASNAVTPALAIAEVSRNGAAAVETLRKKAQAAQATGKKTATRDKKNLVPNPSLLLKRITEVVTSAETDLFNEDFKFIEVDRKALVKLAEIVGFKADGSKPAKK